MSKLITIKSEARELLIGKVLNSGLSEREIAQILKRNGWQMSQQSLNQILYEDRQVYAVSLEIIARAIGYRVQWWRDTTIHVPAHKPSFHKLPYAGKDK